MNFETILTDGDSVKVQSTSLMKQKTASERVIGVAVIRPASGIFTGAWKKEEGIRGM